MKSSTPITMGAAVASDVLSMLQIPLSASLQLAAEAVVAKVRRDAMDALCKELRDEGFHGKIHFDEHDIDPLVEMIFQFTRAVADGTAKANLQLLAQVIAGLKKGGQMSSDAFRKWRKVLEDLTADELVLVGCAYRVRARRIMRSACCRWQKNLRRPAGSRADSSSLSRYRSSTANR